MPKQKRIFRFSAGKRIAHTLGVAKTNLQEFIHFLADYVAKRLTIHVSIFEKHKNLLVRFFMAKRGRYNRPFLHTIAVAVLLLGIIAGPMIADTYPVFSKSSFSTPKVTAASAVQSITVGDNVFETQVSQKPRDSIIAYTVEQGDTVSTVAQKFGISQDTVRWANNLSGDELNVGDTLQILPVTGVAHKVQPGDTVYSIAKQYNANPQAIVDWPFNDFANSETFSLINGEMLIVPDGSLTPQAPTLPTYIASSTKTTTPSYKQFATGVVPVSQGGWFWPVADTIITQGFSWYHSGVDLAGPLGTPVYAAHSGTISYISVGTYDTGYGNNVWIDDGDGVKTHYAHLNTVSVSVGQAAIGGKTIVGYRGSTGRSTGPHVHFEVQVNGVFQNPLNYISE